MSNKTNIYAALLIIIMVAMAFSSLLGDALTTDESPHTVAGYSYLTQQDMRLNPEHPPLIKDIAAIPLLFQDINFPSDNYAWKDEINGQWTMGDAFFFESGNDPDKIMLAARSAVLIFLVLIGILLFRWSRKKYGDNFGLFTLFLFTFSPTFLAHGRLVTTDVGATFGFLLALYFFLLFLESPSRKNLIYAGLALGVAQLIKFSLFILLPFFVGLMFVSWFVNLKSKNHVSIFKYATAFIAIVVIAYLLVWPVYQFHVWNYPPERQVRDTAEILSSSPFQPAAHLTVWMADKPILRPYAQYMLGLLMVFQRTAGGNTTYFLGDVSSTAWKHYFPTVFSLKVPAAVLVLILISVIYSTYALYRGRHGLKPLFEWIRKHLTEFAWVSFIIFYWGLSISGNLNIGIRHVLPTFPFIYLLLTWQTQKWVNARSISKRSFRIFVFSAIVIWYFFVSAFTFPFYLSYFNEIAQGPANGYKYVVDSNLDWGQDLKRLEKFVEENNIQKIKVHYFGGDSPAYRLGDRYEKLDPSVPNQKGWLAISATPLQNGRGVATKGFDQVTTNYEWLNNYEPVARIGFSIFVYNIK